MDELRPVACGQPHFVNHYGAHMVYHKRGHGARQRETLKRQKADEERDRTARQAQAVHELVQAQVHADMRIKLER